MRRASKPQPESVIQSHVYQYLHSCPEYFGFSVYNGAVYDPKIKAYRANRGAGRRNGISDLLGSWNGQFFAVEIKTLTGRLSVEQKAFRDDVIKAGGLYITIKSVSEIVDWVRSMRFVAVKTMMEIKSN